MKRDYDQAITQHYRTVAEEHGLSPASTMADDITRERETRAIERFVEASLARRAKAGCAGPATIMDVGCGNGHTLAFLAGRWPEHRYLGVEYSEALRPLAASRFTGHQHVDIVAGDIRDAGFAGAVVADILVCQRVVINVLDAQDQRAALLNIVNAVASPGPGALGGTMLFVEAFAAPLNRLNAARAEFDLPSIPPAHHNLYLPDGFFDLPQLQPFGEDEQLPPPNMLSTHYYVARVLHPVSTENRAFRRNSEFVKFFSESLKPDAGDYAPLKLYMFEKTGPA